MECKKRLQEFQVFCEELGISHPKTCKKYDISIWFFEIVMQLEESTIRKIIKLAY